MANNRFARGSGKYTCLDCKKETRDTGAGEAQVGLCKTCYQAAEEYNAYQDGDLSYEEFQAVLEEIDYQGTDFERTGQK